MEDNSQMSKTEKKKTSAKQDYQDSDLGMQQSKCCALPLGDSPIIIFNYINLEIFSRNALLILDYIKENM